MVLCWAYLQEVGFENSPSDHVTRSIWYHVGVQLDFTSILHSHTPLVLEAYCKVKLDRTPPFHPMRVLGVSWSRALSLVCEVALRQPKAPIVSQSPPQICMNRLLILFYACNIGIDENVGRKCGFSQKDESMHPKHFGVAKPFNGHGRWNIQWKQTFKFFFWLKCYHLALLCHIPLHTDTWKAWYFVLRSDGFMIAHSIQSQMSTFVSYCMSKTHQNLLLWARFKML